MTPTKPSTGHFVRALVCGLWILLLRPAVGHPVAVPPASRYLIDNWEIEDGLPENSATSMGQTQDGYLWFGTFNGLVRFDGVRFKVFDPGNTPELPSPGIVNLHVDSSGRLWVSTLRGLVIRERGRWINLGNANGWKGNYVRTFAENAGVLGMTSFDWKVARADVLGHVEPLPDPPGNLDSGCFAYVDALGRVWAIKREFAGYWDGTKWQSTPITSLVAPDMRGAAAARDGGLLVLQTTGLHRVRDNRLISSVTFQHEVAGAWNLHEDREGTVWVTDIQQGLHSISREGRFTHYTATNGMEFSSVRFVEEDREQNLWVGTSGNGLFRLKPRTFAAIGLDSGLPERLVKSIAESKSGFHYFATYGRDAVQMKDGRISPVTAGAAVSGYAQSVLVDREDRLWVGSYSTGPNDVGLYYIDPLGRHPVTQADSGGGTVNALFEDSTGRLWIGGDKAAMVRGPAGFGSVQKKGGGALAGVRAFAEEPVKKTIWAINDEGLYEYGGNEWREFTTPGGKRFGESSGLTFDREGALWLGTAQDGLLRIKNGQLAAITHAEGLPTYFLSCMLDDGLGYWWIGCNKGVIRVAKKDLDRVADRSLNHLPFQLYNTSDGLPSSECPTGLQPTGFRDSRGHLWFATTKGAAVIDPHFPNLNITQPEVRIERLTYVDQGGISHEIDEPAAANISIPPGSRELEISYDALTFRAPEKVQLAYRLGGKSEPWIDIGNRRSVFFHTLHPGQLELSIKAANDSGLWNDTGASIILDVRPFVWQTLWFRLLAAVGTAGAIGTAVWRVARTQFQLRLQKLEHENKLAEQQARLAAIVESSDDAIIGVAPNGSVTSWNGGAETILGYNSQEVVGRPLTDAIPDSTGGDGPNLMEVLRRGDRVQGYQARYRRKSGQAADLSITVSPILDPDGKPAGASIIARDVTLANRDRDELQRTLTDLERSNRELEQFAYVASHDLQEPLRAVAGCVQILAKRYQTKLDNSAHELITHAVDGSQRMQTLIHDLLALSRVGSRGGKLTPVDSQAACQQAVKNLAIAVAESGAVIRFEKLPWVLADQTQLVQLFQNLIGNAMKYRGAREPKIEVTASRTGDFWEFIVQDNGIGIESQYFERIFGVFQRLHTRLEYPGTGIGLAICKKIAERHGGRIWVESTPGVGTTMHFTLPAPT